MDHEYTHILRDFISIFVVKKSNENKGNLYRMKKEFLRAYKALVLLLTVQRAH